MLRIATIRRIYDLSQTRSNREIARLLDISRDTVNKYLAARDKRKYRKQRWRAQESVDLSKQEARCPECGQVMPCLPCEIRKKIKSRRAREKAGAKR